MSIFNPQLETQIQPEQAVRAPEQYSPLAAIAEAGSKFLRATDKTAPSAASLKQANTAAVSRALDEAAQLKEQGKPYKDAAKRAIREYYNTGSGDLPNDLKDIYQGVVGEPFAAIGYQNEAEYEEAQVLESETGVALTTAVRAQNPNLSADEVDEKVFQELNQIAIHNQSVALADARVAAGLPVEATPILQAIQSDFKILAGQVKSFQQDGIVTKAELDNGIMQTRALISSKYAAHTKNPQIKAVQDQMFALLDDVGKGVSQDRLDVQLDAIELVLRDANIDQFTIAATRALIKEEPQTFVTRILNDLKGVEQGSSIVDSIAAIMKGATPPEGAELGNFYDIGSPTRPPVAQTGEANPAELKIPTIADDPEAYQTTVEVISKVTGNTSPSDVLQKEDVRNSWLKTVNLAASAVAAQSDEYILGEKLLTVFANNGIVNNLEAVYQTDAPNAEQTSAVLQKALAAERIRNDNELNQRLNSGAGEGQLILVDSDGKMQLNNELIESRASSLYGGKAGWQQMQGKIEAAGGLEAFLKLPRLVRGGANLDAAIVVKGRPYFLKDIFGINFDTVTKLANNMRLIDTKLKSLADLDKKYNTKPLAKEAVKTVTSATTQDGMPDQGTTPETAFIIKTQEDYDAVPVGSFYVNPSDGYSYRKRNEEGGR